MQSHVIPVNIKYLKSTVFLVDCLDLMFLFLDDLRSVFYCLFFTYKSELYPTSPTSYLNRGGSNLINSTLTDYDDVPGRGNYFYNGTPHEPHPKSTLEGFGLKEIKLNVRQLFFFFVVKTWPTGERSSGKKKKIQPPLRGREWEWASARPHYGDECGHKLMSLTCCTYLFLCVTMSHYAPVGIKQPSVIPGNALHAQTESKIHNATTDWSRNFTLHLRDTLHKQTHCST